MAADARWVNAVFVHIDGGTDVHRERERYFGPVVSLWRPELPKLLPLAPAKEKEAWALADREVLRGLVRRSWAEHDVFEGGRLTHVENLTDPKRTLREILDVGQARRRRSVNVAAHLPVLAARIRLEQLDRVPSFVQWSRDAESVVLEAAEGRQARGESV